MDEVSEFIDNGGCLVSETVNFIVNISGRNADNTMWAQGMLAFIRLAGVFNILSERCAGDSVVRYLQTLQGSRFSGALC